MKLTLWMDLFLLLCCLVNLCFVVGHMKNVRRNRRTSQIMHMHSVLLMRADRAMTTHRYGHAEELLDECRKLMEEMSRLAPK